MSFLWLLCVIFLSGYLSFTWFRHWVRAVMLALSLPGPPTLPFFGNTFNNYNHPDFLNLLSTSYNEYGPIFRGWMCFIPVIFVLEPKYLQVILGSNKLTDKPFFYDVMRNFIGEGLITNSGTKWKSHRKYIQPFLNPNILEQFIPIFSNCSQDLVKNLKNHNQIKITAAVNKWVLDTLHEGVLGISATHQAAETLSPFNQGDKTFIERILKPWLSFNFIYMLTSKAKRDLEQQQTLNGFTKSALETLKAKRRNMQLSKWCFLECLLEISENNSDFTEEDVVNEACTFMLAGQDSVGAAASFTLYYLAKHQDVQDKVVKEVHDIFLKSSEINMEMLNKMTYLEQCIKETIRLCPSVPLFARLLSEDVTLGKQVLPTGCLIVIATSATHRIPYYYPDPEKYDPERFSTQNQEQRNPFSFIPFSAGPRNCIGYKLAMLEIKTVIATLLQNYQFSLMPGKGEIVVTYNITLKAKGGIWLKIEPRKLIY